MNDQESSSMAQQEANSLQDSTSAGMADMELDTQTSQQRITVLPDTCLCLQLQSNIELVITSKAQQDSTSSLASNPNLTQDPVPVKLFIQRYQEASAARKVLNSEALEAIKTIHVSTNQKLLLSFECYKPLQVDVNLLLKIAKTQNCICLYRKLMFVNKQLLSLVKECKSTSPYLMTVPNEGDDTKKWIQICLVEGRIVPRKTQFEMADKCCVGSSKGMIIFCDKAKSMYLFDPFPQKLVALPQLSGNPIADMLTSVRKVVLSSRLGDSKDTYAVCLLKSRIDFAVLRVGEQTWKIIPADCPYIDLVAKKDLVYFLTEMLEMKVWNLKSRNLERTISLRQLRELPFYTGAYLVYREEHDPIIITRKGTALRPLDVQIYFTYDGDRRSTGYSYFIGINEGELVPNVSSSCCSIYHVDDHYAKCMDDYDAESMGDYNAGGGAAIYELEKNMSRPIAIGNTKPMAWFFPSLEHV